jgi:hypothetical protein
MGYVKESWVGGRRWIKYKRVCDDADSFFKISLRKNSNKL